MAITGYANIGRTVAELVAVTEEHLGKSRHQLNKMNDAGGINAGDTTVTFEFDLGGIRQGSYVEIEEEVVYVWAVNTTTKVATIERGMLGTTAASHADDTIVRVNPRFLRVSILRALREEIASWPLSVYAVLRGEYDVGLGVTAMDLDGLDPGLQGLRLLKVWREQTGTTYSPSRWPAVAGVALEASANLDEYPSGYRLVWPNQHSAGVYQVAVGGPFDVSTFTSATDLGAIGLSVSMVDIAPLGAAGRLLLPKEAQRTDDAALGRSRLAEEVPPGHTSRTAEELFGWRDRRLDDEAKRLLNDYGWSE